MIRLLRLALRTATLPALAMTMAACAPAPLFKAGPASTALTPQQVTSAPQQYRGRQVVWGGTVVSVTNLPASAAIQVLAYPLDASQRPRLKQPPTGRFIADVAGFVEPLNYPTGTPVTLAGTLDGMQRATVGEAAYEFPTVRSAAPHRWTAEEMAKGHPNVHFGVGVGVGTGIR